MSDPKSTKPKSSGSSRKAPDYEALSSLGRDERMQQAGWKVMSVPDGAAMLTVRGGQQLLGVAEGDDVELYADVDGKGMWKSGFVALSEVMPGEMGGPYDGEDVVWVGKSHRQGEQGEKRGDEWPARYLRLARGRKPTFAQDQQTGEGAEPDTSGSDMDTGVEPEPEQSAGFTTTAQFYRRDQRRYPKGHPKGGQWIEEGRGERPGARRPLHRPLPLADDGLSTYIQTIKLREKYKRDYPELAEKEYVRNTTQAEVAELAAMGVEAYFGRYDTVAKRVVPVLKEWQEMGYDLPEIVVAAPSVGLLPESAVAAYRSWESGKPGGTHALFFNTDWFGWDSDRVYEMQIERLASQGWISTDTMDHSIYHELAHKMHHDAEPFLFELMAQMDWERDEHKYVAGQVSMYATHHPVEFVAEVFTGLINGREYSEEVMEVYDAYNGPDVPKKRKQKAKAKAVAA